MSFFLVDSHCHLDSQYFPSGPHEVLNRARQAGIGGFVIIGVGTDLEPARYALQLAEQFPRHIVAAMGFHPHDAALLSPENLDRLAVLARSERCVAIGETGLDYYDPTVDKAVQQKAFTQMIALARELRKPLVIHTRQAACDTLDLLEIEGAYHVGGVIHCFTEDKAFAQKALDLGFYLSFSGIVTFKNAQSIQEVAAWAPLDRILLETDSPYLAPVPLRGKPCEPAYLIHTAKRVAELRGITLEQIAEATTFNAQQCFRCSFDLLQESSSEQVILLS